jgi:hypothetical protein
MSSRSASDFTQTTVDALSPSITHAGAMSVLDHAPSTLDQLKKEGNMEFYSPIVDKKNGNHLALFLN